MSEVKSCLRCCFIRSVVVYQPKPLVCCGQPFLGLNRQCLRWTNAAIQIHLSQMTTPVTRSPKKGRRGPVRSKREGHRVERSEWSRSLQQPWAFSVVHWSDVVSAVLSQIIIVCAGQ